MASKVEPKRGKLESKILLEHQSTAEGFCSECIYTWCSKKGQVTFCSLKTKGFFECKSCMLKLVKN